MFIDLHFSRFHVPHVNMFKVSWNTCIMIGWNTMSYLQIDQLKASLHRWKILDHRRFHIQRVSRLHLPLHIGKGLKRNIPHILPKERSLTSLQKWNQSKWNQLNWFKINRKQTNYMENITVHPPRMRYRPFYGKETLFLHRVWLKKDATGLN